MTYMLLYNNELRKIQTSKHQSKTKQTAKNPQKLKPKTKQTKKKEKNPENITKQTLMKSSQTKNFCLHVSDKLKSSLAKILFKCIRGLPK